MKYENICYMLKTIFVADFSFSDKTAISIYLDSLKSSGKLVEMREELKKAFDDPKVSWRDMLFNDEYEVLDFETEREAKNYVKRVLLDPILE